jgi:hypothetical protein
MVPIQKSQLRWTQLHQLSVKVPNRGRVGQSQNSDGDNNISRTLNIVNGRNKCIQK